MLVLGLAGGTNGRAQSDPFGLSFTPVPDPAVVGADVTFFLSLTNQSGLFLNDVRVTAVVEGPLTFVSATNRFGTISRSSSPNGLTNTVVFILTQLAEVAPLAYTFRPFGFGTVTHHLLIESFSTLPWETNYVTGTIAGRADLQVAFSAVPTGVLSGDLLSYSLWITNQGPDFAANIQVTNTLPAGLTLLGVDPAGQPFTQSDSNVIILLGALADGASAGVQLRVQPELTGSLALEAVVGAPGFENPAGSNRQASATLAVSLPGPGQLSAVLVSPQVFHPQTGLMHQRVRLRNDGTNAVSAARLNIGGLTNWLYNATGTNETTPFVTVPETLAPQAEWDLWLQLFSPTREPTGALTLTALEVPVPSPVVPLGTVVPLDQIDVRPDGTVWLEFPTTLGRRYAVLYGKDIRLIQGAALPFLTAPANRLQWMDSGPPLTAPASPDQRYQSRFYQVLEVTWPPAP